MKPKEPRGVEIVHQDYQPSKKELEETIVFPDGTTPDELARAVMQPVKIHYTKEPRRED